MLRLFLELAEKRGLTFYTISHVCGMTKPRAWNLLHGKIEQFNSETLIDILARFGVMVDVVVTSRTVPRYLAPEELGR